MTWQLDTSHSGIQFGVKHMLVATTRGRFTDYAVDAAVDERDVTQSHAVVTINAASVETGDERRDGHLKSADFFDVEQFPTITFASRRIEPAKNGEFKLIGDLTIRGITKEVTLDAEVAAPTADPFGLMRAGISAEGKVNRKDFGLTWSAPVEAGGIVVGDSVKLTIDLELNKQN